MIRGVSVHSEESLATPNHFGTSSGHIESLASDLTERPTRPSANLQVNHPGQE